MMVNWADKTAYSREHMVSGIACTESYESVSHVRRDPGRAVAFVSDQAGVAIGADNATALLENTVQVHGQPSVPAN